MRTKALAARIQPSSAKAESGADHDETALVVAANFTAEPLREYLEFWMSQLAPGKMRVDFSPYNQVFQEMISPTSLLSSRAPGVNLLLVRLEDWARDQSARLRWPTIERAASEFASLLEEFSSRARRPTILMINPPSREAARDPAFARSVDEIATKLLGQARRLPGVVAFSAEDLAVLYPVELVDDREADRQAHIPFTTSYWAALATFLARKVRTVLEPASKVIVVDADNTLWGGVAGEVGAAHVRIEGEWRALQAFLLEQKQRGRLLALASKNEEADVAEVFHRKEMVLRREDFVSWKVNWEPKHRNVSQLGKELELGLDSFVFLDDSPVECAEMEAHCPAVISIRLPAEQRRIPEFLKHVWAFDSGDVTREDEKRTAMYREQAERNQFRARVRSFREFLDDLRLDVQIQELTSENFERAAQLTQRTNQFNSSGIRHTSAGLSSLLNANSRQALILRACDRFGDYGEVGLAVFSKDEELHVESFLLSCRVLGKGVEHLLLQRLGKEAQRLGANELVFQFKETGRNLPVKKFFDRVGAEWKEDGAYYLSANEAAQARFDPEDGDLEEGVAEEGSQATTATRTRNTDYQMIASELTSAGAIIRYLARHLHRARPQSDSELILPRSEDEAKLRNIWEEVLHVSPIGVTDSLFFLGGQSLEAAAIASRVLTECRVQIPLGDVLSHPTIAELSDLIQRIERKRQDLIPSKASSPTLSPTQKRLWFLDQFIPNRAAYNIPVARRIKGELHADALERAVFLVVSRHDGLRSFFPAKDGAPRLDISETPQFFFRSLAVSTEEQALGLASEEARRVFDLTAGPLISCLVLSCGQEDHLLVLNVHHILSDGLSMGILLSEIADAYRAVRGGSEPQWEPDRAQYTDYAAWQNERLAAGDFQADLEFWKKELSGAPRLLELPIDKPRQAAMTYQGNCVRASLPREVRDSIESLAASERCTPYTVLFAAWRGLLSRYSQQNDMVLGVPVAGRTQECFESIVGCFVNTLAIRTVTEPQQPFREHIRVAREQLFRGFAHQELPFEHLVNELGLERDLSRSPLFQVVLVQQEEPGPDFAAVGFRTTSQPLHNGGAKFDLVLEVTPCSGGYQLTLEFSTSLFLETTAEGMLRHFACFLLNACGSPDSPVESIPIMDREEVNRMLTFVKVEAASAEDLECLHKTFERRAREFPHSPALSFEATTLTYEEVNRRANRIAHFLRTRGVGPDVLVGICIDRSADLVLAILGVLKAGGAYLPIDLSYPADRLLFMLADAQASVLLTEKKLTSSLPPHQAEVVCLDDSETLLENQPDTNPETSVQLDDLAYVIYTSGSTGKPKGCMVTHRNVARLMRSTEHWFRFNERDVWTLFHSCAFDFSVWEIWGALLYGGRLVVVPFLVTRSPESFYELLAREHVTVLNQTPSAFRQLIQVEESGASATLSLRYIIFGGEALEMRSLRPWFDRHGDRKPQLVNMYGITETTVHVTYRPLSIDDLESGSVIGTPIPDLQIYILDPQGSPVPVGVPGEMYVGGAGLARGYLRRPELTEQRFVPDHLTGKAGSRLYRTGDLARFLPGREIEYLGRIDDQVKIRGFRIELGEIESILCLHPAVREASVIPREDVPGSKQLVAYVVCAGTHPSQSGLREHLKKKLPEYMVPAAFVFLDALPLTNNGKIDRRALPAPEPERPEMTREYVAPRTSTEKRLASIWSKVLRVEKVGAHDNFFELGGDSILSIHFIALARREGLKLTPTLLFENQTIAELSRVVGVADKSNATQESLTGNVALTPIQHWFFEQNLEDTHHYNQAFLLEVASRLDRALLETALQEVSRHHDSLRLRFVRENGGWKQFYSATDQPVPLEVFEVGQEPAESQCETIESAAATAQAKLNLQTGPTWRVAYFDRGEAQPGRLLVVVHHLAVDGISWRPLLEDIETAYTQLAQGLPAQLPAKTTSFQRWAEALEEYAKSDSLRQELHYWEEAGDLDSAARTIPALRGSTDAINHEGAARTLLSSLSPGETLALLQQVPAVYNTQINDALLTAFAEAWRRSSGNGTLFTNVEGHGRENLLEDVDLSRTIGWFTSIFPVRLELPMIETTWQPGEALKSIKEQLRRIPQRGIGYGLLRYLGTDRRLHGFPEPPVVFNYLGQFDQVLGNSRMFSFASESSGPWHSPKQQRRYALEVNCLVLDGQLQIRWMFCPGLHSEKSIEMLAGEFVGALRELIEHCSIQRSGGRTPADFPLAGLEQSTLDKLLSEHLDVEDIYALSPTQALFFSASPAQMHAGFDQWQCELQGQLDVSAFQRAWHETVNRHSILRSSIHSDGLREPLQVVRKQVDLPWAVSDWSRLGANEISNHWAEFLQRDRAQPLNLSQAPVMRFALLRVAENRWKFLWSVPALLLDGWSWPLVFRDASRIYEALAKDVPAHLGPVPRYRDYLQWLETHSFEDSRKFWSDLLSDFSEPTVFPAEEPHALHQGERFVNHRVAVASGTAEHLHIAARRLHVTLNSLVQGAWALLLSRQSNSSDVVFGSAFSGRPTDLQGAESIVGPFVTSLPVRVAIDPRNSAEEFFRKVHSSLLALSTHQFTSLPEIQRCSRLPERLRLFDSLVVFQNYRVDSAAQSFGGSLQISEFVGPIHTNYPLLLLVEPQGGLNLALIYDSQILAQTTVERWSQDLAKVLDNITHVLEKPVGELRAMLSTPAVTGTRRRARQLGTEPQNFVPAQSQSELAIAAVWQEMFALDRVSVEENFFDLGGHSLLLVQMHRRLQETIYPELSIVRLFEHPTVRSLARYLDQAGELSHRAGMGESQNRARQQRQALEQLRARLKK